MFYENDLKIIFKYCKRELEICLNTSNTVIDEPNWSVTIYVKRELNYAFYYSMEEVVIKSKSRYKKTTKWVSLSSPHNF